MHTRTIVSLIAIGLFAAAAAADDNRTGGGERQWLSIPQVHARLEAAGYRHIEKIERENGSYEVKARTPAGERIKLYLHPQTGEVIEHRQRERDTRRSGYDQRAAVDQRNAVECSKRRCRDDLPQSGGAAPMPVK